MQLVILYVKVSRNSILILNDCISGPGLPQLKSKEYKTILKPKNKNSVAIIYFDLNKGKKNNCLYEKKRMYYVKKR